MIAPSVKIEKHPFEAFEGDEEWMFFRIDEEGSSVT